MLEPALREFLDTTPQLLDRPLVWIERIEFIDSERSLVTYLRACPIFCVCGDPATSDGQSALKV